MSANGASGRWAIRYIVIPPATMTTNATTVKAIRTFFVDRFILVIQY